MAGFLYDTVLHGRGVASPYERHISAGMRTSPGARTPVRDCRDAARLRTKSDALSDQPGDTQTRYHVSGLIGGVGGGWLTSFP